MRNKLLFLITIIIFSNSYSQCGQYIENKISALTDIRFWDENNGITIGSSSLLITNDGGISWQTYDLPYYNLYNDTLNDLQLIDSNKAFIFGVNGIILYTENNGKDWERRIGINGLENFKGVHFITSDLGYLVGINDNLYSDPAFLYKTIDGGSTWTEVSSNIASLDYNDFNPEDTLFLDENIGFVWGRNKFYKTIDGGETWLEINNPSNSYIKKLQFIDSQTMFLSGGSRIYKSTDAGISWVQTDYIVDPIVGAFTVKNDYIFYSYNALYGISRTNVNGGDIDEFGLNLDGYVTDIYFLNDNIGFAVGKKEPGVTRTGRFIFKTTDGGITWTALDSASPFEGNSNSATYFRKTNDNDYIYTVVSGGNFTHSSVLLSQDKGASWQKIYETDDVIGYTLYAEDNYISHWRYSNPNNYADGYIISESFDKGETWTDGEVLNITDLPADTNYSVTNLTQVSINDLYIFGFGNIYHSIDKGLTWELISTPNDVTSRKYQFIDENNFMLYGSSTNSEPIVYKTNDGGTTWDFVAQIPGYSYNLQFDRFDYSNVNMIYFYPRYPGNKIFIYDILNQNLIERDNTYFIDKIKGIDDDSLMILDNNGDIYISNDNGSTWSPRFWGSYGSSYPNIYVEDEDNIFLWDYNFIQNLKKIIPSEPDFIFGNHNTIINTEEEYIIPVDIYSTTEWVLESGGTIILDNDTSYYKTNVLWETTGTHTLKAKRISDCGETIFTEINVTVDTELSVTDYYEDKISIYPNPFDKNINVTIPQKFVNQQSTITITNILGQTVYKNQHFFSTRTIEINNIPESIISGIYFINVESNSFSITKKLIKK